MVTARYQAERGGEGLASGHQAAPPNYPHTCKTLSLKMPNHIPRGHLVSLSVIFALLAGSWGTVGTAHRHLECSGMLEVAHLWSITLP